MNDSEVGSRFWRNDENQNGESDNNDYFFHDDIPESDFEGSIKSTFDVVPPDVTSPDNKNSTNNLIRLTSFTSRNRGLVSGRQ
jgi:hypothetical protein